MNTTQSIKPFIETDDAATQVDLHARASMAVGMVLDRSVSSKTRAGTVYQFGADSPFAELTAKGWAALFATEGR